MSFRVARTLLGHLGRKQEEEEEPARDVFDHSPLAPTPTSTAIATTLPTLQSFERDISDQGMSSSPSSSTAIPIASGTSGNNSPGPTDPGFIIGVAIPAIILFSAGAFFLLYYLDFRFPLFSRQKRSSHRNRNRNCDRVRRRSRKNTTSSSGRFGFGIGSTATGSSGSSGSGRTLVSEMTTTMTTTSSGTTCCHFDGGEAGEESFWDSDSDEGNNDVEKARRRLWDYHHLRRCGSGGGRGRSRGGGSGGRGRGSGRVVAAIGAPATHPPKRCNSQSTRRKMKRYGVVYSPSHHRGDGSGQSCATSTIASVGNSHSNIENDDDEDSDETCCHSYLDNIHPLAPPPRAVMRTGLTRLVPPCPPSSPVAPHQQTRMTAQADSNRTPTSPSSSPTSPSLLLSPPPSPTSPSVTFGCSPPSSGPRSSPRTGLHSYPPLSISPPSSFASALTSLTSTRAIKKTAMKGVGDENGNVRRNVSQTSKATSRTCVSTNTPTATIGSPSSSWFPSPPSSPSSPITPTSPTSPFSFTSTSPTSPSFEPGGRSPVLAFPPRSALKTRARTKSEPARPPGLPDPAGCGEGVYPRWI